MAAAQPGPQAAAPAPQAAPAAHEAEGEACSVCADGVRPSAPNPFAARTEAVFAYMHSGCPLNRREVGRASWAYLHTLAAYYPDKPSRAYQEDMRQFILSYARFYPCGYCADTTSQEMVRNPPRMDTRKEFQQWMCEIHNEVNDRLGKPLFDCAKVDERWRTGAPGCR